MRNGHRLEETKEIQEQNETCILKQNGPGRGGGDLVKFSHICLIEFY